MPVEPLARRPLPHEPTQGLWTHQKGGFYHDGRFATLRDVVDHYDALSGPALLSEQEKQGSLKNCAARSFSTPC
jgi:hypothetical protein